MQTRYLQLCLVSNLKNQSFQSYQPFLLQAIRGGITSFQLREKTKNLWEFRELALQFKSVLRPFNIPLIINDHVEIAKEIDAEGVHIGQSDMSPQMARKILGPHKILGLSIENFPQLNMANELSCIDYVAASAVFPSKTKPDCKTIWGLEGLRKITALSKHPVVGIGGITQRNIKQVMESGASGAAVIGAIHDYLEPEKAAQNLLKVIDEVTEKKRELVCYRR
jgi:thiamine-phosphate pyrophosphorylase